MFIMKIPLALCSAYTVGESRAPFYLVDSHRGHVLEGFLQARDELALQAHGKRVASAKFVIAVRKPTGTSSGRRGATSSTPLGAMNMGLTLTTRVSSFAPSVACRSQ